MSKHIIIAVALTLCVAAGAFAPDRLAAQTPAGGSPAAPQTPRAPDQSATDVAYTPPLRGAPGGRVGGASRGAIKPPEPLPTIDLLAPADHAGQTMSATPTLYYFVSRRVSWPMQLTISAPLQPKPTLEIAIPAAGAPGIYALRLADYRARLEPGIVYTWSVSIVLDPKAWSRNIVASATILRVPPNGAAETAAPAAPSRVAMLARAGLWYDAIATAFDSGGVGGNAALNGLLQQVGLTEVVQFDRSAKFSSATSR